MPIWWHILVLIALVGSLFLRCPWMYFLIAVIYVMAVIERYDNWGDWKIVFGLKRRPKK